MVVRFLPLAEHRESPPERERGELAEVIELRSRLPQVAPPALQDSNDDREPAELREPADFREPAGLRGHTRLLEQQRSSAADDAVRLLARRARSSGELRRELTALEHDKAEIEDVVLECEASLYLDDLGLARVLCEGLRERKRASRAQIRVKLRERLLPDAVIEQVVGELDDDAEHELLREAAVDRARKLGGLDRQTAERRLLGFLARRGWGGERALRVTREALDGAAARGTVRFR